MTKFTAYQLRDMVYEQARKFINKDVEKIADEIIDQVGEDNCINLDMFWKLITSGSVSYIDSLSGKRFFY